MITVILLATLSMARLTYHPSTTATTPDHAYANGNVVDGKTG
jgi:hypothetical protein